MKRILATLTIVSSIFCYCSAQKMISTVVLDSTISRNQDMSTNDPVSGNSFKISVDDFNKGVAFTPIQLIQGRIPGFTVNNLSGNDPNPNIEIQARGTSTLFLNTDPLYIVDGIPMEDIDFIIPDNIVSIEVLQNLSETAQYGIRGGNGVVLIRTRQDNPEKISLTYSGYSYIESLRKNQDYLSATEWRQLKSDWSESQYERLQISGQNMVDYNGDTDWLKEISQKKLSQVHNLGISGSLGKTSYKVNMNYAGNSGIIKKTDNKRYNGQFAISQLALNDKLKINFSLIATTKQYNQINDSPFHSALGSNISLHNIISLANSYNPTIPLYNPDGTFGSDPYSYLNIINPLERIMNTDDDRSINNLLSVINTSYQVYKDLKISASFSKNRSSERNINSFQFDARNLSHFLYNVNETNDVEERIFDMNIEYTKSFGDHHVYLLLGYSDQLNYYDYYQSDSTYENNSGYGSLRIMEYSHHIDQISGYLKYDYQNKYYLALGMLEEKSTLYNYNNLLPQYFPSAIVGWSIGNEGFMKNIGWLNELNIRGGYGVGQRHIDDDLASILDYDPSGSGLHGENMHETNLGINAGLFTNRIYFSIDYYDRLTEDALRYNYYSPLIGRPPYYINEIAVSNKGLEFFIEAQPMIRTLKWTIDFNLSLNRNTVLTDIQYYNYTDPHYISIIENDEPIGNFLGNRFKFYSEIPNNRPLITNLILNNFGNGVPETEFGLNNTLDYNNFEFSMFLRGATGFNIINSSKWNNYELYELGSGFNFYRSILSDDQRDIIYSYYLQFSDYSVEIGDYLKIDNITVSYSISCKNWLITRAKVYLSCDNVAILTRFRNGDPESVGITGVHPGIYSYEKYPNTRLFSLGLKINI